MCSVPGKNKDSLNYQMPVIVLFKLVMSCTYKYLSICQMINKAVLLKTRSEAKDTGTKQK